MVNLALLLLFKLNTIPNLFIRGQTMPYNIFENVGNSTSDNLFKNYDPDFSRTTSNLC